MHRGALTTLLYAASFAVLTLVSWGVHAAITAAWSVDAIVTVPGDPIRLRDKEKNVAAVITKQRATILLNALARIQKEAGITAGLHLVQTKDRRPNAFAWTKEGRHFVAISLSMLELLDDDIDAYAFLMGHELAHSVRQHGSDTQARQGFLQGLSVLTALIIGARTGVNVGGLTDLGAGLIDRTFSRDQEREADRLGLEYMAAAGFNPEGSVRLQERLMAATSSAAIPFLSTHPTSSERIANLRTLITGLPVKEKSQTVVATASSSSPTTQHAVTSSGERSTHTSTSAPKESSPSAAEEKIEQTSEHEEMRSEPVAHSSKPYQLQPVVTKILPGCRGIVWNECVGGYSKPEGRYHGEFAQGKPHGQGTSILPNGDRYVGEFNNGVPHGEGTLTYHSGDVYVGEVKDGKRHGNGTHTLPNGSILHSGAWMNDQPAR